MSQYIFKATVVILATLLVTHFILSETMSRAFASNFDSEPVKFSTAIGRDTFSDKASAKPIEWTLDLGQQWCNSELEVEWTIENQTNQSWESPQITASCSCMSGTRKSITIPPGTNQLMSFKIHLPRVTERLSRQIVFWDGVGNALAQANVVCDVRLPLQPKSDRIDVAKEGKQTIKIPMQSVEGGMTHMIFP